MTSTCSISKSCLARLARLGHAADNGTGPLHHISLRVTAERIRFAATDGKLLAAFIQPMADLDGQPVEAILDRDQFTAACKVLAKGSSPRVTMTINHSEVRLSCGRMAAVVFRHNGGYPNFDHIWTKPAGMRWVPCCSSLDTRLVEAAQYIVGKTTVAFSSPVPAHSDLLRIWSVIPPGPDQAGVPLTEAQALVRAAAYWCDHELALLVMAVTRSDGERQLDLGGFALPLREAERIAA